MSDSTIEAIEKDKWNDEYVYKGHVYRITFEPRVVQEEHHLLSQVWA